MPHADRPGSALVQGRDHLSAPRQVVLRRQQRRHRRFPRPDRQARLHRRSRRQRALAAAVLSLAAARRRLRHRRLHARSIPSTARSTTSSSFIARGARRGIRVITELVINHTSDQHPWFQRARQAPSPARPARNFYVWSDTDQKYQGTRIIFIDTERSNWTWDPVAKAYYWHRFYSHQPDLNFDNPAACSRRC